MWEAYLSQSQPHAQSNAGFTIHQKCQFSAEISQSYIATM